MNTSNATLAAIVAASAAVFLGACSPADRQEARSDVNKAGQTAKTETSSMATKAGNVIDDATLTTKVKAALLADEQVKGTQINVDSSNGTVTLSGAVGTPAHKQRAEQLAMNVEGVRTVRNNLTTQ